MRPLRLSREHGGVRAHGRDGGHDAHRSNGENVLGYVRAEPRPLRNASVRLTASLLVAGAAPIARALSGGGVFRQAQRRCRRKNLPRTKARSRSYIDPGFSVYGTGMLSHRLAAKTAPPDRLAIKPKKGHLRCRGE
jgi:hypothetical protein